MLAHALADGAAAAHTRFALPFPTTHPLMPSIPCTSTPCPQIVRLVQSAQMSKAPVQAFADRVSAVFVPVVVALSFITWFTW